MPLGLLPATLIARSGERAPASSKTLCAPPRGFRAAGGVRSAWPCEIGPFGRAPSRLSGTAAQRAGIRYERKALAFLAGLFGSDFAPSIWFKFFDGTRLRWCQVDGLLLDARGAVIFEVKTSFTPDAYYQLKELYEPVVRKALLPASLRLVIVCKNFDPSTPFPVPFVHTELVGPWRDAFSSIAVFQWRG